MIGHIKTLLLALLVIITIAAFLFWSCKQIREDEEKGLQLTHTSSNEEVKPKWLPHIVSLPDGMSIISAEAFADRVCVLATNNKEEVSVGIVSPFAYWDEVVESVEPMSGFLPSQAVVVKDLAYVLFLPKGRSIELKIESKLCVYKEGTRQEKAGWREVAKVPRNLVAIYSDGDDGLVGMTFPEFELIALDLEGNIRKLYSAKRISEQASKGLPGAVPTTNLSFKGDWAFCSVLAGGEPTDEGLIWHRWLAMVSNDGVCDRRIQLADLKGTRCSAPTVLYYKELYAIFDGYLVEYKASLNEISRFEIPTEVYTSLSRPQASAIPIEGGMLVYEVGSSEVSIWLHTELTR